MADEPVSGLLTPAREAALAETVNGWLEGAVESEGFEGTIQDYVERAVTSLLEPDKTFQEILPLGLVGSVEKAIASYLPLALKRLGGLLEDPEARRRFERTLHELFHRFLRDLNFYQRVVARLIVTEEAVDKVLDTIEQEGVERLSEMLREKAMQDAMARGVNDAIVDFPRRRSWGMQATRMFWKPRLPSRGGPSVWLGIRPPGVFSSKSSRQPWTKLENGPGGTSWKRYRRRHSLVGSLRGPGARRPKPCSGAGLIERRIPSWTGPSESLPTGYPPKPPSGSRAPSVIPSGNGSKPRCPMWSTVSTSLAGSRKRSLTSRRKRWKNW